MLFLTIAREPTLRSGSLVPATSQHREAARGPLQEAGTRGTAGSEAPGTALGPLEAGLMAPGTLREERRGKRNPPVSRLNPPPKQQTHMEMNQR